MGPPVLLCLYTLFQSQKCYMVIIFSNPGLHWYPDNPFSYSLHSHRTCYNFFSTGPLMIQVVYLILIPKSNLDIIHICLNTPTIRARIKLVMSGPPGSNVLMKLKFLLTRFWLYAVMIELRMKRISASPPSSVLLTSSIIYIFVFMNIKIKFKSSHTTGKIIYGCLRRRSFWLGNRTRINQNIT